MARVFSQDRSIVNLGRPSPVAISLGVASPTVSDKLRSLDESEFPVRLSSYETSREDEAKKNDVEAAHFTSNKEFFVPGRYQANTKDRTSLMRSAHLAQEPIVSLKPKTQEFGLLKYVLHIFTLLDADIDYRGQRIDFLLLVLSISLFDTSQTVAEMPKIAVSLFISALTSFSVLSSCHSLLTLTTVNMIFFGVCNLQFRRLHPLSQGSEHAIRRC